VIGRRGTGLTEKGLSVRSASPMTMPVRRRSISRPLTMFALKVRGQISRILRRGMAAGKKATLGQMWPSWGGTTTRPKGDVLVDGRETGDLIANPTGRASLALGLGLGMFYQTFSNWMAGVERFAANLGVAGARDRPCRPSSTGPPGKKKERVGSLLGGRIARQGWPLPRFQGGVGYFRGERQEKCEILKQLSTENGLPDPSTRNRPLGFVEPPGEADESLKAFCS